MSGEVHGTIGQSLIELFNPLNQTTGEGMKLPGPTQTLLHLFFIPVNHTTTFDEDCSRVTYTRFGLMTAPSCLIPTRLAVPFLQQKTPSVRTGRKPTLCTNLARCPRFPTVRHENVFRLTTPQQFANLKGNWLGCTRTGMFYS